MFNDSVCYVLSKSFERYKEKKLKEISFLTSFDVRTPALKQMTVSSTCLTRKELEENVLGKFFVKMLDGKFLLFYIGLDGKKLFEFPISCCDHEFSGFDYGACETFETANSQCPVAYVCLSFNESVPYKDIFSFWHNVFCGLTPVVRWVCWQDWFYERGF